MRWSIAAIGLGAILTAVPALAQQPPADLFPPQKALWAEVRAVNDSMEAAFNRGDMKAVSRFYADDARMAGLGGPVVSGREALDSYWARMGAGGGGRWKLEMHKVGGNRELAYESGRSTLVTRDASGKARESVVDFVVVWKRDAKGGLRILLDLY